MQHTDKYSQLKDISGIRTGYSFKEKLNTENHGDIMVFQPRNIENPDTANAFVNKTDINQLDKHLLRSGEILLANKGIKFATYLYIGSPEKCIATSGFFIISVDQIKVLPEYLIWFLNQSETKKYLEGHTIGSTIPSLNKPSLENLKLPIPPITIQKKIKDLLDEVYKEKILLESLIKKRQELSNNLCWDLINSNS